LDQKENDRVADTYIIRNEHDLGAYDMGQFASRSGEDLNANPFPEDNDLRKYWELGWRREEFYKKTSRPKSPAQLLLLQGGKGDPR
jgi:hypothetical protein